MQRFIHRNANSQQTVKNIHLFVKYPSAIHFMKEGDNGEK